MLMAFMIKLELIMRYKPSYARRMKWTTQALDKLEELIKLHGIEVAADMVGTSVGSAEAACKQHGISVRRSKK